MKEHARLVIAAGELRKKLSQPTTQATLLLAPPSVRAAVPLVLEVLDGIADLVDAVHILRAEVSLLERHYSGNQHHEQTQRTDRRSEVPV